MTLQTNFCSSPWFHMEIRNSGDFGYCRWANDTAQGNIQQQKPLHFFRNGMSSVRHAMLQGQAPTDCEPCYNMEKHHKVSGRQRQLLKTGVVIDQFEKSLRSSTYWTAFAHSNQSQGATDCAIVDWQINLGNHCNSACVFCSPDYSSRLATEFQKLNLIQNLPGTNWAVDSRLLDQFVQDLAQVNDLAYLHFIGGETLLTPAFVSILEKLIAVGINDRIDIGFTTNLTVWDQSTVDLLKQFRQVHLGMSIECLHAMNDYVRWPSEIGRVKNQLGQWIQLGQQLGWYLSLRTTPTALTVPHLVSLYDFANQQNVGIESCNFLQHPAFLRMSVLPMNLRLDIADQIETWVTKQNISSGTQMVNVRDPNQLHRHNTQDAGSYVDYLRTAPDESHRLSELVQYLKTLESSRGNCVLDYAPEYENIFRSAGY